MDFLTISLLAFAVLVAGSILIKAVRDPAKGWGGPHERLLREKPSADEPTPARSVTATGPEAAKARRHTPAA